MRTYYVYVMSNPKRTVLYIGFTGNLVNRVEVHKQKSVDGFSKQYNCTALVYFEETTEVQAALERERQLKKWSRKKKDHLIISHNPQWKDLSLDW